MPWPTMRKRSRGAVRRRHEQAPRRRRLGPSRGIGKVPEESRGRPEERAQGGTAEGEAVRWAAKRDGNEASIIALFEAHGCAVKQLSQWKVADLLVSWPKHPPPTNRALRAWTGRICLVEVKRKGQDVKRGASGV